MKSGIVPPLRTWQPVNPRGGLVADEATQVVFHGAIQDLYLAIRLGVIGQAAAKLRFVELDELLEGADENRILVADDGCRHAMEAEDLTEKDVCHFGC